MSASVINLTIEAGASFYQALRLINKADSTPFPLNGWTGRAQMRRRSRSAEPVVDFTVEVPDPAEGLIVMRLTAPQTSAITVPSGYYNLEIQNDADPDTVIRLAEGTVAVKLDVSR